MLLLLTCCSGALETLNKTGDSGPPINKSSRESTAYSLKFHIISAAAAAAAAAAPAPPRLRRPPPTVHGKQGYRGQFHILH